MSQTAPRRVLWIHQNFVSGAQPGSERATNTISAFLEQGWAVDLVTGRSSYLGAPMGAPGVQQEGRFAWWRVDAGSGDKFVRHRARAYLRFLASAARIGGRLQRPDIVFASSPPLPQMALSLWMARRHRAPLVVEIRDLWPSFLVDAGLVRSAPLRRSLEALEGTVYKSAAKLVSVSPAFRPFLEERGVAPADIVDVPHGTPRRNLDAVRRMGADWRRARGLEGKLLLLYAGSLNESHGLRLVLDAAERTAGRGDLVWLVAGSGRGRPLLEAAARGCGNLVDLGAIARSQLDPVLGACDIGLVALAEHRTFRTVLPGKLVDYLSVGLPVICSAAGQPQRIVEVSKAGWSCRATGGDLAETALAVARVAAEERRARGDAGANWVRRHMSGERQGRAIADLCGAVLDSPPEPPPRSALTALLRGLAAPSSLAAAYRAADTATAAFDAWLAAAPASEDDPEPLRIPLLLS